MMFTLTSAHSECDDVWENLLANPPTLPQTEERLQALRALDTLIAQPNSETSPRLIAYYRRAVDRVLDLLETESLASDIRLLQMYSNSVIVQTPETVFALELDQGPNQDLTITPEQEGVPLCMTEKQVARVAGLVEYSFHTHRHDDHLDYQLTRALLEAGKTVFVTQDTVDTWAKQPFAEKLTVLEQTIDEPHAIGPLKVDVLWDHQWGTDEHTSGIQCNAHLITTPDDVSILSEGDINCGMRLLGWLNLMKKRGRHVDLFVTSSTYWRGVDVVAEIDELFAPVWVPVHCWEFTHRPTGEPRGGCRAFVSGRSGLPGCRGLRCAGGFFNWVRDRVSNGVPIVLSWGEYLDYPQGDRG